MATLLVTSTADSGSGSLRQAISDAEADDVILFDATVFPAGTTTAILLASSLTVAKDIEIDGDGRVALDGQNSIRVIALGANDTSPFVKNLTIQNGAYSNGAGLVLQGGLSTVEDCVIRDCDASGSCGGVYGVNAAVATLNRCEIFNNTAANNGGGVYANNTSQLTFNACEIHGNSATNNGGGCNVASSAGAVFNNCRVYGNLVNTSGGGINASNTAKLQIHGCEIDNNTSYTQPARRDVFTTVETQITASTFDALFIYANALVTLTGGVTSANEFTAQSGSVITIADGAALTLTGTATIGAVTFTSDGRGYLATASGVDVSSATFSGVVLCSYGAGLETFEIDAGGAVWTADDLTVPILIERRESDATWTTLSSVATGGTYSDTFAIGTTVRAFDGVRFFSASLDAYWRVDASFGSASGGGGAGDDAPLWSVVDATITPNLEEV